ncbi:polysaccharide deacetylase [Methylovirgula ligni]|uniref:Chitooligosaccharide deacetylase n=1 Tax=Methylovirgula ligni TaxID=569860 RepID=A0A3D9YL54_9HYPH|nr:glycosyltransferase [Methylovirgula ligni]QAY96650.1 polysaccharide deacetylase [Methylovirgula ligni]REF83310.1 cellulose synthase/poly-beta-1,6-N-acetylglucosamine synthase-like glycosyltransferase [Methylovirgula ligni]
MRSKPVFFDPTGKRAVRLSWSLRIALTTVLVIGVAFVVLLFANNAPLSTSLEGSAETLFRPPVAATVSRHSLQKSATRVAAELRGKERDVARLNYLKGQTQSRPQEASGPVPGRSLSIGFYANWDQTSFSALEKDLPHLDWVIPTWLSVKGDDIGIRNDLDHRGLEAIRDQDPDKPIFPLLQNSVDGKWDSVGLAKWLADPVKRAARLKEIIDFLDFNQCQGLTVDFEEMPDSAQADLQTFLKEMSAAFKPRGWKILLSVPFDDDSWDYAAYSKITDYLILMAYDEHWETGTPGPVASQGWYEKLLDQRMKDLDPDHTIVAIGNYGYDWSKPGVQAEDVTFPDVARIARMQASSIDFDADAENPHFTYKDNAGQAHNVWFLDAVSAFNEVHAADIYRPAGYAVWRLGAEDPSIWTVLGRPYDSAAPEALKAIPATQEVYFQNQGEILHVAAQPSSGQRVYELDPETGDIVDENYETLPSSFVIQRFGSQPKKIALTFDDGPDPTWTPQILDILKAKHVEATFFIIGENAGASPDIVEREYEEGHDVGNHTFTHPNVIELPLSMAKLEINATRRLFEAITGHSMRLFRAPFMGDSDPTTMDELVPVALAQSMGFVSVGLRIDPDDWLRPPAQTIVDRILKQVSDPDPDNVGNVILLHDAGGDRSETIKALPELIDALRARGFQFVTASQLAGLTREQAMPALPPGMFEPLINRSVFYTLGWSQHLLQGMFIGAIWLGFARVLFLSGLGLIHRIREARRPKPFFEGALPQVSVIIPAHNEAAVIAQSVERILSSTYPGLEVIIIDDGSTDGTSAIVQRDFGHNPAVKLLTVPNGGKANAINQGLAQARGSIIVALDADTLFEKDTIANLTRWFVDPAVGAVAGNAKVGNRINTITKWQALEYISAQNLERRALVTLGCMTVVPGAVGAWRREALEKLGRFPTNTLAEDQDLTISVQKAGYSVVFDSEAVAWTEAPDTFQGLIRQRFRWAYGTLQCLWKHRDVTFRPRFGTLGLIAMPQVWLFQVLLTVMAPLVDFMLVWQILHTGLDYLQHRNQFNPDNLLITLVYFGIFMATDFLAVALAFVIEGKENWRLMLWLGLQRIGYRQILYYVVVKSVITALLGPLVGWNKLDRKATVSMPAE